MAWYSRDLLYWGVASVVFGPVLGIVGASIRSPRIIGLLAELTVPVGAILQMIVLPPGWGLIVHPAAMWARMIVCIAAAAGIGISAIRFLTAKQRRGSETNAQEGAADGSDADLAHTPTLGTPLTPS